MHKRWKVLHRGHFVSAAKTCVPVGEVFQLNLIQQHAHTHADRGSSSGLCSRMDSLKILMKLETDTMECFVGNVSGSVLPERIFLSNTTKAVRRVRVHVCVRDTG